MKKKQKSSVSIVVPTFNGKELLKKHLPAIFKTARRGDQLLIVDDASTDGTLTFLKRKFKLQLKKEKNGYQVYSGKMSRGAKSLELLVIKNLTNQRFAASVNRAFDECENRLVFLLNNDVQPEANCVRALVETFDSANIFAVGCLEYEGVDKTGQRSGKNRLWFEKGLFHHQRANNFAFGQTAWASGGSAMFDRNKWRKLGGFDLKYQPAYWEDIDISYSARKAGYTILFQPKAVVYHQHESTNSQVFSQKEMIELSWKHSDYFTRKHADIWQRIAYYIWRPYWCYTRRKFSGQSK